MEDDRTLARVHGAQVSGAFASEIDVGKLGKQEMAQTKAALQTLGVGPKEGWFYTEKDVGKKLTAVAALGQEQVAQIQRDPEKRKAYAQLARVQQSQEDAESARRAEKEGRAPSGGPMRFEGIVLLRNERGSTIGTMDMTDVKAVPLGG
jgi:hypothetical protein